MSVRPFEFAPARSVAGALESLASGASRALAGGTDLVREMRRGTAAPPRLVGIATLEALRSIERAASGVLRIGAAATLAEIASHPAVLDSGAALAGACAAAASQQVRNVATLGGNLCQRPSCWYYRAGEKECVARGGRSCAAEAGENAYHGIFPDGPCVAAHPSDAAPALIALGAIARVGGSAGERALPVEDLYRAPTPLRPSDLALERGELILDVLLPAPAPGARSVFEKARDRRAFAFALASVALAAVVDAGGRLSRCRVAVSGVGPRPYRLRAVESAIEGRTPSPDVAAAAGARAVAGARPLPGNGYKAALVRGLVAAAVERFAG